MPRVPDRVSAAPLADHQVRPLQALPPGIRLLLLPTATAVPPDLKCARALDASRKALHELEVVSCDRDPRPPGPRASTWVDARHIRKHAIEDPLRSRSCPIHAELACGMLHANCCCMEVAQIPCGTLDGVKHRVPLVHEERIVLPQQLLVGEGPVDYRRQSHGPVLQELRGQLEAAIEFVGTP